MEELNYIIYTDGAYSFMRNQGGVGLVFIKNGEKIGTYSKNYKNTTNNRMELLAVIIALNCIKNPINKLTIISDSQYVIGTITKGWKRGKNQDLWDKFDKISNKALTLCNEIDYKWVHGHESDEFNNLADELAVKASKLL